MMSVNKIYICYFIKIYKQNTIIIFVSFKLVNATCKHFELIILQDYLVMSPLSRLLPQHDVVMFLMMYWWWSCIHRHCTQTRHHTIAPSATPQSTATTTTTLFTNITTASRLTTLGLISMSNKFCLILCLFVLSKEAWIDNGIKPPRLRARAQTHKDAVGPWCLHSQSIV